MPSTNTYQGSCHCGKVRYDVTTDLKQVIQCNCSLCSRAGYLLTFVGADQFKLHGHGADNEEGLTDYQFNKHIIHHLFCKTCGVRSFARGKDKEGKATYAINVRCLEGVDPNTLEITKVDGKSS